MQRKNFKIFKNRSQSWKRLNVITRLTMFARKDN